MGDPSYEYGVNQNLNIAINDNAQHLGAMTEENVYLLREHLMSVIKPFTESAYQIQMNFKGCEDQEENI